MTTRAAVAAVLALALPIALSACGQATPSLSIHVVKAGTIDPFGAATNVRARILDENATVIDETTFAIASQHGAFPMQVPFATARAQVESLDANGKVVGRGSGRFHLLDGTSTSLSVFVGVVDSFFDTTDAAGLPTSLPDALVGMTATPLDDGEVLITGGARLGAGGTIVGVSAKAYLFDPDTGAYTPLPDMKQARAAHTATVLRPIAGRSARLVVIAGGLTVVNNALQASATAEIFDPATKSFGLIPMPLGAARAFHTATLLVDGGVLIAGGMQPVSQMLDGTARWDQLAANATPKLVERIVGDPAGITQLAGMLDLGRWDAGAVRADQTGRVILVGGRNDAGAAMDSTSVYDPTAMTWVAGPVLSAARAGVAVVRLDTGVLALGGRSTVNDPTSTLGTTDLLDVGASMRSDGPTLAAPRAYATLAALTNNRVLLVGGIGADGNGRGDAEIVTTTGATHITTGGLGHARALAASALLPGGQVLIVGGAAVMGATWDAAQIGEVFVDPLE